SLSNRATLAFYQGDYARSQSLHARALAILEAGLGPQHPLTCLSRNNLAQIYTTNGKLAQAATLLARNNRYRESLLQSLLSVGAERDKLAFMATLSEEADFTVTFNTRMAARGRQATGIALT